MKSSLTKRFPFLLPLRRFQRKLFFYIKMRFDNNRYARTMLRDRLEHTVFETKSVLVNENTGSDVVYQQNKAYNLELAAKTLNHVLIRPGETFSFWQLVRYADKQERYKDGLCLVDGRIVPSYGGGLCQMSNTLYWLFLHTSLTVTERHSHSIRNFPYPPGDVPEGADATVSEGWSDLKVKNNTDAAFQLCISFDERYMHATIRSDKEPTCGYEVFQKGLRYFRQGDQIIERVSICRRLIDKETGDVVGEEELYENSCRIGYPIPEEMIDGDERKTA